MGPYLIRLYTGIRGGVGVGCEGALDAADLTK